MLAAQVIAANVTVTDGVPLLLDELTAPLDITHTYSVRWFPTNITQREQAGMAKGAHQFFFPQTLEVRAPWRLSSFRFSLWFYVPVLLHVGCEDRPS